MKYFCLISVAAAAALFTSSSAFAADLIVDPPAAPEMMTTSSSNWDGFYLGVFGGYGAGTISDDDQLNYFYNSDYTLDISGWMAGVTAGANFTLTDGIVGGLVGDIAWSNLGGSSPYPFDATVNWLGSVRGNLGFDAGAFMPYVTGGLAFANMSTELSGGTYSDSQTHLGWTVGAGVQVAATDNMAIDVVYRYSDYGSKDYGLFYDSPLGLTSNTVQVGLNWKF